MISFIKNIKIKCIICFILFILVLIILYVLNLYNYLLMHTFIEVFSVCVAITIFLLVWNSKKYLDNDFLILIGISFLFVGLIDLIHTLTYKGLGIITNNADIPTQLWISARYMQSLSALIGFIFLFSKKRLNYILTFSIYTIITIVIFLSIFYWKIFPDAFIDGKGLTPFKIVSEYIISLIFLINIFLIMKFKNSFDKNVHKLLVYSFCFAIISELFFTYYSSVYDIYNMAGHYFKLFSFYCFYLGIVEKSIKNPQSIIFRNMVIEQERQKEINELKKTFLATLTHDLKSPIHSEQKALESIISKKFGTSLENFTELLEDIYMTNEELLRIVNNILSVYHYESGKVELKLESNNIADIIENAVKSLLPLAKEEGSEITVKVQPNLPLVKVDRNEIYRVMTNLLSNAIKHNTKGTSIIIFANIVGKKIQVSVQDNGKGIPKAERANIFQRYPTTKRKIGTGLGLYLSKQIIDAHQGTIWFTSEEAKGSTFYFTISIA